MDGYSNLTQAIQDGVRIDWARLARRKVKITGREGVEIFGYMTLNPELIDGEKLLHLPSSWVLGTSLDGWVNKFLRDSFCGSGGFELYIAGEIPVELRTADELEPGTGFLGKDLDSGTKGNWITYRIDADPIRAKLIDAKLQEIDAPADEIEVIEVYGVGIFQATKEEA